MGIATKTVRAVNGLTARWAGVSEGGTVFSAAAVWPLLAHLADGAGGPARAELAEALGLPAGQARLAARELHAAMSVMRGLHTALGLWTARTLELTEQWEAGLPADAHGVLTGDAVTDRQALDAWTAKRTGGLIGRMPVTLAEDTQMVLASALATRTRWLTPFDEVELETAHEPWATRARLGLRRSSAVLDRVGVADTPDGHITELKVLGNNALDVHLLLGEETMKPRQVLEGGLDILAGRYAVAPGPRLPYGHVGPGLSVEKVRCTRPEPPSLEVTTAAYDMHARHDLLKLHRLFGLTAARDTSHAHFPGISDFPLAIGSAEQHTRARFNASGFEAAAVTAFGAVGGGRPDLRYVTTHISAAFDRPFGFLALHRHTRLVLTAGWVTDPLPLPEHDRDDDSSLRVGDPSLARREGSQREGSDVVVEPPAAVPEQIQVQPVQQLAGMFRGLPPHPLRQREEAARAVPGLRHAVRVEQQLLTRGEGDDVDPVARADQRCEVEGRGGDGRLEDPDAPGIRDQRRGMPAVEQS